MKIHFYLNDKEQTHITSMWDMQTDPFKIGDLILLNVDNLRTSDIKEISTDRLLDIVVQEKKDKNEKLKSLFLGKTIKIVSEKKYMRFKSIGETYLTIEYYCKIVK